MTPFTVCKHHLDSFFLVFQFSDHALTKTTILNSIDKQQPESLQLNTEYCSDNITKLDWLLADNFTREWTLDFKPKLDKILHDIAQACGYVESQINELWFQQYYTFDKHGWHTHGSNFTGVYYLELPNNAPRTQLVNPFTQTDIIIPNVNEGDILIFPSYVIHRAPVITNTLRKTIISFNCNFDKAHINTINNLAITSNNNLT